MESVSTWKVCIGMMELISCLDLLLIHLGDFIIADYSDHQIKKITKEGRVVIIAGSTEDGTLSLS
jgi:hypothetical protein